MLGRIDQGFVDIGAMAMNAATSKAILAGQASGIGPKPTLFGRKEDVRFRGQNGRDVGTLSCRHVTP
jgi:hypothetical protein